MNSAVPRVRNSRRASSWSSVAVLRLRTGQGTSVVMTGSASMNRSSLVTAAAEAHEGGRGIREMRLSRLGPPFAPLGFETAKVIAWRRVAAFLISFARKRRQRFILVRGGQGTLDPSIVAIEEGHIVAFLIEAHAIIRQMIVLRDMLHHLAKTRDDALGA